MAWFGHMFGILICVGNLKPKLKLVFQAKTQAQAIFFYWISTLQGDFGLPAGAVQLQVRGEPGRDADAADALRLPNRHDEVGRVRHSQQCQCTVGVFQEVAEERYASERGTCSKSRGKDSRTVV